jgi:hypothetical protein
MARRAKAEPRTAAEFKSATGRVHQARGAVMRDLKMLQELNANTPAKPAKAAKSGKAGIAPGGIRMGS